MTTEQLRLEIEVAAKEAMKTLSATSDEYKRLAKEVKAAVPPANELKDTMTRLQADLKKSETAAKLFDDQLGGLKERQALLRSAMVDLIDKGLAPESREMQDLKLEYDAAAIASKELETQTGTMSGSFDALKGSLGAIGAVKAFTTVATGVLDAGKAAVSTAGDYEMLKANFETLTGSTAAATAEFNQLKEFANVTPFDLQGVAKSAQILQAAKVPIGDLTTRLGQLGDLSLGNSQKFDSMVGAFSKMAIKGKVDLEQLNIVMEAGVPILDELAKGYGKTTEEVFDMLSKGKVSTQDFIAAMEKMTSQGGQYFGGMARGAQTYTGILSTYKDSIDNVAASFGELLLPTVKSVLGILTNLNAAIASSPLLKGVIAGVLVTAIALLGAWAVAMAASTVKTWLAYAAEMALNAARAVGNPVLIAAIAAVGVATAGYIAYASAQIKATEATASGSAQAKLSEEDYKKMSAAMKEATDRTGNYIAAQAAVEKLKELRSEYASLQENIAKIAPISKDSAEEIKKLQSVLAMRVVSGSKSPLDFPSESAKIQAFTREINALGTTELGYILNRSTSIQEAIKKGSSAAIAASLANIKSSDPALQARLDQIKAQITKIESGTTITPTFTSPNTGALSEDAKKWIAEWDKAYAEAQASSSSDPYASLDNEKKQKIADAKANGVNVDTAKKTIDEINALYASKRETLTAKLAADERAALVKLTDTKLDDLRLEEATQIANLNDLETKAVAADKLTQEQISAIHSKYAALRASVDAKYATQITDTQKNEAQDKAAAAFDLANKERAATAALTASQVDDLEHQRDRELALFVGTEDQKLLLARNYAKKIADAQIAENRRAFEESLKFSQDNKDYIGYAGKYVQESIKDTEVGQLSGAAGTVSVDPVTIAIQAIAKFILSIQNVQAVLNPISTILEGARDILEPFINNALQPIVDILTGVGQVLSQVLAPFINNIATQIRVLAGILSVTLLPVLKLVGAAFAWFNDYVIVPVGNAIISVINVVIKAINAALGWAGVSIDTLDYLQTTTAAANEQAEIAKKLAAVNDQIDEITALFDEKKNALKDAYDKNISALKNLLELGAVSESDYATRISKVNSDYKDSLAALQAEEDSQLSVLEDIRTQLQNGINVYTQSASDFSVEIDPLTGVKKFIKSVSDTVGDIGKGIGDVWDDIGDWSGWWDVGSSNIPQDQAGVVHKGEMIVPRTFADGLRSGEISISGKGTRGTTIVYQTTVSVAGSVLAENDLADTITRTQARRKRRGALESEE